MAVMARLLEGAPNLMTRLLVSPVIGHPTTSFSMRAINFRNVIKMAPLSPFMVLRTGHPTRKSGYFVGFVPFKDGKPNGEVEVFADGFAGVDPIVSVKDAVYRPMGIAFGPDGSMYLSDSVKGKIWKITYNGDRDDFGEEHLLAMEERKKLSHIRTPDSIKDNLMPEDLLGGAQLYQTYCSTCHQMNGKGASGRFPPLIDTDWVTGDKERLINVMLRGMEGSLKIGDEVYNGMMPQHRFLNDTEIAQVLTYVRSSFGNDASSIEANEVEQLRKALEQEGNPIMPIKTTTE